MKYIQIIFIFFITFFSIITIIAANGIRKTGITFAKLQGIPVCNMAHNIIDGDRYEKLANSLDKNDPYYEEANKALKKRMLLKGNIYKDYISGRRVEERGDG